MSLMSSSWSIYTDTQPPKERDTTLHRTQLELFQDGIPGVQIIQVLPSVTIPFQVLSFQSQSFIFFK